jgi:hypothetical protein
MMVVEAGCCSQSKPTHGRKGSLSPGEPDEMKDLRMIPRALATDESKSLPAASSSDLKKSVQAKSREMMVSSCGKTEAAKVDDIPEGLACCRDWKCAGGTEVGI